MKGSTNRLQKIRKNYDINLQLLQEANNDIHDLENESPPGTPALTPAPSRSSSPVSSTVATTGSGLKKKARTYKKPVSFIIGSGPLKQQTHYIQLNKFMIDIDKLESENKLIMKYVKTRNTHNTIPRQHVSNPIRDIIIELARKSTFNKQLYDKLRPDEKLFIIDVTNKLHIDVGLNVNTIDQKQKVYDVLLGEVRSGNNNPMVIKQLKQLITDAIHKNEIPLHQGLDILKELQ